jgi:hypothetical protein
MSNLLVAILPFALAAARSLTLGIQSLNGRECPTTLSTETEYEFLKITTFCLLGLLATLTLMMRFQDLGAAMSESELPLL